MGRRNQWSFGTVRLLGLVGLGVAAIGYTVWQPQNDDSLADPVGLMAEAEQGSDTIYYEYCDDARAAGVAPISEGDPGYSPHLDRDRDGVACEPYR